MWDEDDEVLCNLEDCVTVYDDCVNLSLPEFKTISLKDKELDAAFFNSHTFYENVDYDRAKFMDELITVAYKMRHTKRQLYKKMGFKKF